MINQEFHPFINEFHQHIANERNYMINLNKEKENVSTVYTGKAFNLLIIRDFIKKRQ